MPFDNFQMECLVSKVILGPIKGRDYMLNTTEWASASGKQAMEKRQWLYNDLPWMHQPP